MDRRQVLAGSTMLSAALAAEPLQAKGRSLREQLLGSWKLLDNVRIDTATGAQTLVGARTGPFSGMIAYIPNGTVSVHFGGARPVSTKAWNELSDAERLMAADTWFDYFGRFEVDEGKQQVRHLIVGSLQPGLIGRTLVRNVKISGRLVTLTSEATPEDKSYAQLTWERI